MTDVRVRSAVVRSVLGLPSRLPEIAIGFSDGGLIASTHLRETRHKTRRFTLATSAILSRKTKRRRSWARCARPIMHAREQCRWCGRSRFPCCSFDRRTHARHGRAFSRVVLAAFRARLRSRLRLAARPMRRLRPRAAELFFDLIVAIGAVAFASPCFHLPCL